MAGERLLSGRYWWGGTGVRGWPEVTVGEVLVGWYWSSGLGGTGVQEGEVLEFRTGRYWQAVTGVGGGGRYRRGVHEARGVYILQASVSHQGEPPPGRDNMAPVTTLTDFTAAFIIYG